MTKGHKDAVPAPGPADRQERSRRRRERFAIVFLLALVLGLTLLEANLATLGGKVPFTSNVLVFALINLNVILIVLLIFLVTRNLFKVILERRRGLLGARLRFRLVFIFIAFSLVPTVLLFVAAANITTTSIKTWIGGRVGSALSGALEITRSDLEREASLLAPLAERAARALESARRGQNAQPILDKMAAGSGAELVLAKGGRVIARTRGAKEKVGEEILSGLTRSGNRAGAAVLIPEERDFVGAARRLRDGRTVVAVRLLPPERVGRIREIAQAYESYHQVRLLDDPIRASYLAILLLVTLLIVFTASWMGIYLAKRITVPVQLLAEGTDRVAAGDLDVRLEYRSTDEFGSLVSSFNRMTADLKEMKRDLEGANVSLRETYEELRHRTRFIEAILTNISTGVIVLDRTGRIAMINRVAERLLRIKTEKVLGRPYKEVVREEHYGVVRELSRSVGQAPGTPLERQVEVSVEGKPVSLRVSVTALHGDEGEYLGLVVAFDDITQAMRLQRVMAWREVARRIAHEIRNPLTPIQLSAERLRRRYAPDHEGDPAFRESTQAILTEVETLKRLVEEFTRFARMPAPSFVEGSLAEEVLPVVETFRSSHPGIAWEFEGDDLPPAWFDPQQIRRAVTNLLENAAAAAGEAGRVSVRCDYDGSAGLLRISVADDGPGVAEGDRDRIFEPYFSRKEGGTGLGLAIVSAIAADHGGRARARDNVPRGTVFEIEFPPGPKGRG